MFAREALAAGERVIGLAPVFVDRASRLTLQLGHGRHQAHTGEIDDFINHGCDPNLALDFDRLELFTLRAIGAGEELRFSYLTTEWDMAEPFTCDCGAPSCLGVIRGFRHLTREQQEALRPLLSPYLLRWLASQR